MHAWMHNCSGHLVWGISVLLSSEGADIMTGGTRRCIVVSTLAEARFYADRGFDDILYAYSLPFDKVPSTYTLKTHAHVYPPAYRPSWKRRSLAFDCPSQVERCAALSERLDLFQVLLDHPDALEQLQKRPLKDGRRWRVWMKLDCGNGRGRAPGGAPLILTRPSWSCVCSLVAGVLYSDPEALNLALTIAHADGVELTGVYAHCGNTYHCRGVEQIQAVAQETTNLTLRFMEKWDVVEMFIKT